MTNNRSLSRYEQFVFWGNSGTIEDVDRLMHILSSQGDFATSRLVDYALNLVRTREGVERLRYYLFNGNEIQRNYAALYFKRRGHRDLLDDAVAQGKIDQIQAYAE